MNHFFTTNHVPSSNLRTLVGNGGKCFLATPCEPRWASKFFVMQNLQPSRNETNAVFNDLHPTMKAASVVLRLRSDEVWEYLEKSLRFLKPLAIVIPKLESDTSTLGEMCVGFIDVRTAWIEMSQ